MCYNGIIENRARESGRFLYAQKAGKERILQMARKLSERDALMAEEFLIDLDAKNAAIRAGYSPKTAEKASEWIRRDNPSKPLLRAEIDKRLAARSKRTDITADRVLAELAKIAFADISSIIDLDSGDYLPDAKKADTAAIASIKIRQTPSSTEREIRLADRNKALELLGKHLGMFDKDDGNAGSELSKLDKLLEGITHAAQS